MFLLTLWLTSTILKLDTKRSVIVPSKLLTAVVWISGVMIIVLACVLASRDIMWALIGIALWSWIVSYAYSKQSKKR